MSKGLCVELREKLEEMGDRLGQYLEQESEIKVQLIRLIIKALRVLMQ